MQTGKKFDRIFDSPPFWYVPYIKKGENSTNALFSSPALCIVQQLYAIRFFCIPLYVYPAFPIIALKTSSGISAVCNDIHLTGCMIGLCPFNSPCRLKSLLHTGFTVFAHHSIHMQHVIAGILCVLPCFKDTCARLRA